MPLLFAIVGIVALCLSLIVLVGPVAIAVVLVKDHRRRRAMRPPRVASNEAGACSPSFPCDVTARTDDLFTDLMTRNFHRPDDTELD